MKTILIVDDDAELSANLAEVLKKNGYHTESATSGREARSMFAAGAFNVVLIDKVMPGVVGLDLLRELKKASPSTKIIMVTAFPTIASAVEAIKAGASDYITKPFRPEELLALIGEMFEEIRFENNMGKLEIGDVLTSVSNPIRRAVILMLYEKPGMRLMEITRKLDIEEHTKVVFHMKLLQEAGIVEQEGKSYRLTSYGLKTVEVLKTAERHLS